MQKLRKNWWTCVAVGILFFKITSMGELYAKNFKSNSIKNHIKYFDKNTKVANESKELSKKKASFSKLIEPKNKIDISPLQTGTITIDSIFKTRFCNSLSDTLQLRITVVNSGPSLINNLQLNVKDDVNDIAFSNVSVNIPSGTTITDVYRFNISLPSSNGTNYSIFIQSNNDDKSDLYFRVLDVASYSPPMIIMNNVTDTFYRVKCHCINKTDNH